MNRLDKHLLKVQKLENKMVTLYVQKAKDRYIARELVLLRASKPNAPMVSHLDEIDDAAIEEGIRKKLKDPSSVPPDIDVEAPSTTEPSDTPPAGEVEAPSAADPPDAASARVTPSNKPASDVMARSSAKPCTTPSTSATNEPASHLPRKQWFSRNKPVVRTPTPLCKNCRILAAELKVVKEQLENKKYNGTTT